MASPQAEHGHIRIANTIWDSFCKTRIPGEARQVLDVVIRQTYGYGKKSDMITLDKFAAMTGLRKADVIRAVKKLYQMNLISKDANGKYSFQKDFDRWKPLAKKQIVKIVSEKANDLLAKKQIPYISKTINTKQTTMQVKPASEEKSPLGVTAETPKPKTFTPLQKVVLYYKVLKGHERDDASWDKLNFARCSKSAKLLIEYLGDEEVAMDCTDWVNEELGKKGLEWTLETVVKRAGDFKIAKANNIGGVR